ncbi:MAG TPA: glycosyltransferase family 39 protein [Steroidobacteraceae bacterium]
MSFAVAAFADVLLTCLLLFLGKPLALSQSAGFGVGVVLLALMTPRPARSSPVGALGDYTGYVAVLLLALALRSGILALLCGRIGLSAQLALLLAAPAGLAVLRWYLTQLLTAETDEQRFRVFALGFVFFAFALRLIYAGCVELLPEEAYYWNYAQHLDIGYLDHPPMVAWLTRLATTIFGENEFAVRAGPLFCGVLTTFFVHRLTRSLFGETAALGALVLVQGLPFFFLAGMILTPDSPLSAAWAASLYFLQQALVAQRARSFWYAGLSLGAGLLSKYSILMLGAAGALFMALDPSARHWWRRPLPYAAAILAFVIFTPVIVWNVEHEFASFAFQTSRRLAEAPRFSLHKLIASVLILITPTGVWALVRLLTARRDDGGETARARRFLWLAIGLPLAVFFFFSLRHEVKLDWTGAPWIAALPLLALGMRERRALRKAWVATATAVLVLMAAGFVHLAVGIPGLPYSARMELLPVGWRDLTARVIALSDTYHESSGSTPVIVGMDRYAIASEVSFYGLTQARRHLEVSSAHLFGGVGLMYERWAPAARFEHRTLLLVSQKASDLADAALAGHAESLGPLLPIEVRGNGRIVATVYSRFAFNYRAK